jgi:hypothetical protein
MNRPRSVLTFFGMVAAALASVATSPAARQTLTSSTDEPVTLTAESPVATVAFKVFGKSDDVSPDFEFSVANAAAEARRLGDAGPSYLRADASVSAGNDGDAGSAEAGDSGSVTPRLGDSGVSQTLEPAVLVQVRERKAPEADFSNATAIAPIPADRAMSAMACYTVSESGDSATPTTTGCSSQTVNANCSGANSCERVFEVRLLLVDPVRAPQSVKIRARVQASFGTGVDKSNAVSIERLQ